MQALSTLISIEKDNGQPVYLQIANQLTVFIKDGNLQAGHRLPSTRQMASWLQVHRKTVIQAYDELLAQGWLESRTGSGTFVAKHLPEIQPRSLLNGSAKSFNPAHTAGFEFEATPHLNRPLPSAPDTSFTWMMVSPIRAWRRSKNCRGPTGASCLPATLMFG